MEEVVVEGPLAVLGIVGLELLGDMVAAADIDLEAADGPQQELDQPLHIAVVCLGHVGGAVDEGLADGDLAPVPLNGDGDGLFGILQIGVHPHAEGNEAGVQLGFGPDGIGNAEIIHVRFLQKCIDCRNEIKLAFPKSWNY